MTRLRFKIASEPREFHQIHRLNYRTFVEEIPQHPANPASSLRDAFHDQNTYIICLSRKLLLAMVAVRDNRPFSLDRKLPDLDNYLPPNRRLCEVRLLASEKNVRHSRVFHGLIHHLVRHCVHQRYDMALISGTLRQQKLYQHLGFVPFGPVVGTPEAPYQPMYLTREAFETTTRVFSGELQTSTHPT